MVRYGKHGYGILGIIHSFVAEQHRIRGLLGHGTLHRGELFDRILEEAEKHEGQGSAACAMQTVRKEQLCREGQKNNMIELISF